MSAKVMISYTDDAEIQVLLWALSQFVDSYKLQPAKGRFKRAYIDIKDREIPPDLAEKIRANVK